MSYADYAFVEACQKILNHGTTDEGMKVRPKWPDGTPAHTKMIINQCTQYRLAKDSIPVMTLREVTPYPNPKFWINPDVKSFYDFSVDDFKLIDYEHEQFTDKIEVAV